MDEKPIITIKKIKDGKNREPLSCDSSLDIRGLCIIGDEKLSPGEIVEIEINPSSQKERLSLLGRIDWCFPVYVEGAQKFILSVNLLPDNNNQSKSFIGYIWRKTLAEICEHIAFQGADRRAFPRICRRFIVKFRPKVEIENLPWQVSIIKNISLGGCYFYSAVPYNQGRILELVIQLPLSKSPIYTRSEVKRCEKLSDASELPTFGVAVQFLGLSSQDKEILDSTVRYFLNSHSS
jgi:hypothetical protein